MAASVNGKARALRWAPSSRSSPRIVFAGGYQYDVSTDGQRFLIDSAPEQNGERGAHHGGPQLDRRVEEMTIAPGTRLGSYEVVAQIGAGGMGEVYRAHDTKLARDVAIKVLPANFVNDPNGCPAFSAKLACWRR